MPLTASVPSAEEVVRFRGLDLAGLSILGSSERPLRAFWSVQFPLLLLPTAGRTRSHKELLCLFPSKHPGVWREIHLCNHREASRPRPLEVSQAGPACPPVCREDPCTPEPLHSVAAGVHTKGQNCHTSSQRHSGLLSVYTHKCSYFDFLAQANICIGDVYLINWLCH